MPFTPITVTGQWNQPGPGDVPSRGQVSFRLYESITDGDTGIVSAGWVVATLDGAGAISIVLDASNDPTTLPVGVPYLVAENIDGALRRYYVTIPYDAPGGTVDLATLVPTDPPVNPDPAVALAAHIAAHANVHGIDDTARLVALAIGATPTSGQVPTWNGTDWVPAASGGGVVDSVVAGTNVTVDNTDPANPVVSATGGGGGAVDSVNGQTGVVVIDAADVGLGNVDNTADSAKPVSAAQAAADSAVASAASADATAKANAAQAAAIAASQPSNAGLTAISALSTTAFGRDLLTRVDAAAVRSYIGLVLGTDVLAPNGSGASLTGITQSQIANLTTDLAAKAPLASPGLTGTPTAPTQTASDNSTKIATTAYVDTADALKANLASPTFTGTPAAPTATAGTNTTQVATTAFVTSASVRTLPTITGLYYSLGGGESNSTTGSLTASGQLRLHPVWLEAGTYDRLGIGVATQAVSTWRLGVYPTNATTLLPDGETLLLDAGTVDPNSATGYVSATVTLTISTTGLYWFAVLCDSYTATPSVAGWHGSAGATPNLPWRGNSVYGTVNSRGTWARAKTGVTTGAIPATCPTMNPGDQCPQIMARKA